MSDEPRLKRPALDRKEPNRSFASFAAPSAEPAEASDPVARAVDLGYRVVDEYIRQGERAARRAADPLVRPGIGSDVQDWSARMFEYASDLAGAWFQLWGMSATGELGRSPLPFAPWTAPRAPEQQPVPTAPAGTPERTRLTVEVWSVRPAVVAVDLREGAAKRPLVVHELRALSPELPRIKDVTFVDGRFRVRIPDDQPLGVYSGAVIDLETSVPAGTLCVTLE